MCELKINIYTNEIAYVNGDGWVDVPENHEIKKYKNGVWVECEIKKAELEISILLYNLSQTDWYVHRFIETQKEIPAEILESREIARERISELRVFVENSRSGDTA